MTHQFKVGDRALLIPRSYTPASMNWAPCLILSGLVVADVRRADGVTATLDGYYVKFDQSFPLLYMTTGDWHIVASNLMPLPKNGPDADQDLARRLVEMHGGK